MSCWRNAKSRAFKPKLSGVTLGWLATATAALMELGGAEHFKSRRTGKTVQRLAETGGGVSPRERKRKQTVGGGGLGLLLES